MTVTVENSRMYGITGEYTGDVQVHGNYRGQTPIASPCVTCVSTGGFSTIAPGLTQNVQMEKTVANTTKLYSQTVNEYPPPKRYGDYLYYCKSDASYNYTLVERHLPTGSEIAVSSTTDGYEWYPKHGGFCVDCDSRDVWMKAKTYDTTGTSNDKIGWLKISFPSGLVNVFDEWPMYYEGPVGVHNYFNSQNGWGGMVETTGSGGNQIRWLISAEHMYKYIDPNNTEYIHYRFTDASDPDYHVTQIVPINTSVPSSSNVHNYSPCPVYSKSRKKYYYVWTWNTSASQLPIHEIDCSGPFPFVNQYLHDSQNSGAGISNYSVAIDEQNDYLYAEATDWETNSTRSTLRFDLDDLASAPTIILTMSGNHLYYSCYRTGKFRFLPHSGSGTINVIYNESGGSGFSVAPSDFAVEYRYNMDTLSDEFGRTSMLTHMDENELIWYYTSNNPSNNKYVVAIESDTGQYVKHFEISHSTTAIRSVGIHPLGDVFILILYISSGADVYLVEET